MVNTSTKIKEYNAEIKASVQTKCNVRTQDKEENVEEYVKNTFIQSMEDRAIYIDGEIEVVLTLVE